MNVRDILKYWKKNVQYQASYPVWQQVLLMETIIFLKSSAIKKGNRYFHVWGIFLGGVSIPFHAMKGQLCMCNLITTFAVYQ